MATGRRFADSKKTYKKSSEVNKDVDNEFNYEYVVSKNLENEVIEETPQREVIQRELPQRRVRSESQNQRKRRNSENISPEIRKKTSGKSKKKKKKSNLVSNILLVTFSVLFLASLYMIITYYLNSFQEKSKFDDLANFVGDANVDFEVDGSEFSWNVEGEKPVVNDVDQEALKLEAYKELNAQNSDMVGWIKIDGTNVNYPVMLTPDDPEYYIKRNFDKEKSSAGVPFVGEGCTVSPNSDHVVIYGHHMKDGSMFADVMDYAREDGFWQQHRYIEFDTVYESGLYELFSIYAIDVSVDNGHYDFYNKTNFANEESFNSFVDVMQRYSMVDLGVTAEFGDQFISLVTCSYFSANGRLVVVAKKVSD